MARENYTVGRPQNKLAVSFRKILTIAFILALIASNLPFSEGRTAAAGGGEPQEGFTTEVAGQLAQFYREKQARTPEQRKIDTNILKTVGEARNRAAALRGGQGAVFNDLSTPLLKIDGTGDIEIKLTVTAAGSEQLRQLEALGMKLRTTLPEYGIIEGSVPYGQVEAVAGLGFVTNVSTPGYPVYSTGSVNSEGDAVTRAAEARASFGVNGSGYKVGVMSDGVTHSANSTASGDLPTIQVLQSGTGDEGTAMLEIIHDLAPGSPLAFYAPQSSADMVDGIRALRNAGAKVIVDDITFLNEPKFEDGPIALEARSFYDTGGVYVTSAGNSAQTHYSRNYLRTAAPTGSGYTYAHDYGSGDVGNNFSLPAGRGITTILQWNNKWGQANDDLDVFLIRSDGVALAGGYSTQNGTGNPFEGLSWTNTTSSAVTVYIVVVEYRLASTPSSLVLDYNVYGGPAMQYVEPANSVIGHAAVWEVLSTATSNALTPDTIAPYSSRGPGKIYFPTTEERQTPNITGIDGVSNKTGQLGYFYSPFHGTSAAAPHLAAIAALVWQMNPALTSSGVRSAILNTAMDRGTSGWDSTWGNGRVDAYQAVASVVPVAPSVSTDNATNITKTSARLNGNLTSLGTATSANVSFQWGTSPGSYPFATTPVSMNATGTFSANITGLTSGTSYYFLARAAGDGTGNGTEKSFSTPAYNPPTVTTGNATGITTHSATISGNLTSLGTAVSANVSFQYGTTSGNLTIETEMVAMSLVGSHSANLTGLSANTNYYFRAKAVGDGMSYGVQQSFTTLSPAPPTVTTDNATSITGASARLNGTLTSLGTAASVNVSFQWGTASGNYAFETEMVVMGLVGSYSANLTGLSANTTYYFRAKAAGDGTSYGTEKSFSTPSPAPPTVTTDNATSITAYTARLNGNLGSLGSAVSANVSFQWSTSSGNYTSTTPTMGMNTTGVFNANLTGLSANTTYYFLARAVGDGTGYGMEKSFTTPLSVPPSVTTDNASLSGNSARLNGTLTSLGTALSANVSFQWGTGSGNYTDETAPASVSGTGDFDAELHGLSANTTYFFRAKAVGEGTGYGGELSFTTGIEQTIQISLKAGWNMVSLPVIPANTAYRAVFPTALVVYNWNPVNKAYSSVSNLEPARGYWVAVTGDTVASVVGLPLPGWSSSVKAGWNMVGSVTGTVSITSPDDNPDGSVMAFSYSWNPVTKSYVYGTTIEAGKGYWVAATRDATLTLSATP